MPEISKMPNAEQIKSMYQKMEQNESENNVYKKQLDKYFGGTMPSHEVINVCSTPNVLKLLGSTAKKVVLNQKDLENAVAESKSGSKSHTEGHDISKEEIYKLSEALRNPIMILKGNKRNQNSVVLITDLTNKDGEKVFVPIALDRQNGKISNISSLYGKKNLSKYISEHLSDILAVNKEKAGMLADTRDQYSQSIYDTVTRYDDSIAYTTANVKYPNQAENQLTKQSEPPTKEPYTVSNPVLSSMTDKLSVKIAKLEDKNKDITVKISKNHNKIKNFQAKISDAQKTQSYCKQLIETTALPQPLQSFFQSMAERQESKVEKLNQKIEAKERKNHTLEGKIQINNKKISKHEQKTDKLQKIDQFLHNMNSREGRRENFVTGLSEIKKMSLENNLAKSEKFQNKIAAKEVALTKTDSTVKKVKLRNSIEKLKTKKSVVDSKIEKLEQITDKLNDVMKMTVQNADKLITAANDSINAALNQNTNLTPNAVVDMVINKSDKTIDHQINQFIEQIADEKSDHQNTNEKTQVSNSSENNRNENKTGKAFDVAVLCAAIKNTFEQNFIPEERKLNTNSVMATLAEKFDFDDVKSAIAVGILDRPKDVAEGKISAEARNWAFHQPLTDNIKPYNKSHGILPLDVKSGFLDVFARKVDAWQKNIHTQKENSLLSRKNITKNASTIKNKTQTSEHKQTQTKNKNNQSL